MRKGAAPGAANLIAKQLGITNHYKRRLGIIEGLAIIAAAVVYGLARLSGTKGFPG